MTPYYEQDGVTIYHCDYRDLLPSLSGFDLVLTDPPYGLVRFRRGFGSTRFRGHGADSDGLLWDTPPTESDLEQIIAIGRHAIIWGANNFRLPKSETFLVWNKEQTVANFAGAELAFTNLPVTAKVFTYSIHQHNSDRDSRQHPTQKPEALMLWCISLAPTPTRTVCDPFMGSGTTLIASKRLGKSCVGIEREERYCEIAAKRLAQGALDLEFTA